MAKVNSKSQQSGGHPLEGESISGDFRKVFKENPALLHSRSNEVLLDRWFKDHPGEKQIPGPGQAEPRQHQKHSSEKEPEEETQRRDSRASVSNRPEISSEPRSGFVRRKYR